MDEQKNAQQFVILCREKWHRQPPMMKTILKINLNYLRKKRCFEINKGPLVFPRNGEEICKCTDMAFAQLSCMEFTKINTR